MITVRFFYSHYDSGHGTADNGSFIAFLSLIPFVKGFTPLLAIYVIVSSFRQTCSLFVRSIGYVKLYAFDGILATVTIFIFNIIFISGLKMGLKGFFLAVIASDLCSTVFCGVWQT